MKADYEYIESSNRDGALKIKELRSDEQPREKALRHGMSSLSVPELLAIILGSGIKGCNVVELCRHLMRDSNNSLLMLERKELEELQLTRGLGEVKALKIKAAMELIKRYKDERCTRVRIKTADDIYDVMRLEIGNLDHEELWIVYVDRGNNIIRCVQHSKGVGGATVFDVKKALRKALLLDAHGMIMCHNHPSGNLVPSREDDMITLKCKDGAHQMDIRLLDHVIISSQGYYSYCMAGKL